MKFTDLFIRRPVLALVINLVIIIAGLQAIRSLNVRQYPRSDNAAVTVTTVYVGASAELVRGFITTPLERAIAAADGIDYIQSQSAQGLSTITVRLKLNYDPIKALAEISSKVDQVRSDLPPEAEVPIINVESADSQFASAYLSFTSDILEQNQITDYLVRVVQPRLSAIEGVQRADILGARTFAMRIWLKPERMAALNISPAQVRQALAANNFLAAVGQTKGPLIQVNLTANTDLRSVRGFKQLVIREQDGAIVRLEDIADVVLGAEDYDTEVRFSGQTAVFMGIWPLPNANSLDVIKRVRGGDGGHPEAAAQRACRRASPTTPPTTSTTPSTRCCKTLGDTLLIVVVVIFLFLGSLRSVLMPVVAIPAVADRRGVPDAGVRLHHQPADAAGHRAVGRARGGRRHRGGGERRAPSERRAVAAGGGAPGRARAGRADHRHDHHAGGGLRAHRPAGRPDRRAVPRVRLHPGRRGDHLRRRRADPVAGDVRQTAQAGDGASTALPARSRGTSNASGAFTGACWTSPSTARPAVYMVWIVVSLLTIPMFMMSPKELAPTEDQGVIFGIVDARGQLHARPDQRFMPRPSTRRFMSVPETRFTFQITFPTSGFGGMVVKPWGERKRTIFQILPEVQQKLRAIPGIRMLPVTAAGAAGRRPVPGGVRHGLDGRARQILQFAQQIQLKAMQSGMFAFPPLIDVKIDQPQSELVIDRDKVADLGLNLQQVGCRHGGDAGRQFCQPLQHRRPQLQGHPADQARRPAQSGPAARTSMLPARADSWCRSARSPPFATPRCRARSTASSSSTPSRSAAWRSGRSMRRCGSWKTRRQRSCPRAMCIDYTGESRQLRTEGNKFLSAFGLAVILIFLVLAAQFNSFRDPFVILAGSVPLAMFGALIFTFLKMPDPNVPFWTNGWTTTLNIYSQVGLVTLVGLVSKNGILIVEFANKLQQQGHAKREAVRRRP